MAGASPEGGAQNAAVKRVGHYSSTQTLLLVGEGDLSFSRALATGFGSGANLVATSLEDYDSLTDKYPEAKSNLAELKKMGAVILHGVDAHTMNLHPDLKMKRFNRILFNFPHAGFGFRLKEDDERLIWEHQKVVKAFFESASQLLLPYGEVHVSHKTKNPYDKWDLRGLATVFGLHLVKEAPFCAADYPGYNNKRGDGKDCDQPFMLGECSTFMFSKWYPMKIKRSVHMFGSTPLPSIENGGVYPNSSAVSGGCWPSHPLPPAPVYGMPPGSGFTHHDAVAQQGCDVLPSRLIYAPQHTRYLPMKIERSVHMFGSTPLPSIENGGVYPNSSAVSGGCRPFHPLPPAPVYGMPPGSGFTHHDAVAQQGYVPQQNSNMAGIIHQDQFSHQIMLIRTFGRHPY